MVDTQREVERKFEFTSAGAERRGVPGLTGTGPVAAVRDQGVAELDVVYYDTPGLRLAADGVTLRRRTGGTDAGWHLKLPVSPGVRDEIRAAPGRALPRSLARLVRSRTRDAPLEPQLRVVTTRRTSHLLDADGALLAQVCADAVRAERRAPGGQDERAGHGRSAARSGGGDGGGDGGREVVTAAWTEVEVELADGTDPALLDAVARTFREAGLRYSGAPSKFARALEATGAALPAAPSPQPPQPAPGDGTAGAYVLAYLREQRDVLIAQDPAVRRGLPDSVHQMRVACRRLRSAFATYGKVLDRAVTGPVGEELRRLAAELGVDRDREVLLERLRTRLDELPRTLRLGPVRRRLRRWDADRAPASRRRVLAALDSPRHLRLLHSLDALLADPPLLKAAARPARPVLAKAVRRDRARLARRIAQALALPAGRERDLALHEARKAAKRARYAAEAAVPALGGPAQRLAKAVKSVQTLLGDHRDGVVARTALRALAVSAAGAGEPSFTWGVLHAREEALAALREQELPELWAHVPDPSRRGLRG
ncbi:CHAD domain-containing protein [Streptomyces sp. NPDC051567]|uniref:CYTH and CHAD domain-containing protein n=1 Tax=Streptomyces sp. NPDC051567 TaxID=3365660 RepID=UPI0037B5B45B